MKIFKETISPIYNMSRYQSEIRGMILMEKFSLPKNNKVLDLCCGSGQYRSYFKEQNYFGVDKFDNNFSKKNADNVSFSVQDASNLSFEDEYFDFLFCSAGLEHVRNKEDVAKEMSRVLKTGSFAYISVPSKISKIYDLPRYLFCLLSNQKFYGHGHHYYSKKDLKFLLEKNGFKVIKFYSETGFFALCWITIDKWTKIFLSIIRTLKIKIFKSANNNENKNNHLDGHSNSHLHKNDEDFDPRDDHDIKTDFSLATSEVMEVRSSLNYGKFGVFFTKVFWFLDYYFPIPIVAAWIAVVKKK